jgi:hypothetical protein
MFTPFLSSHHGRQRVLEDAKKILRVARGWRTNATFNACLLIVLILLTDTRCLHFI